MVRFLYLKMTPDELYQFSDCLLSVVVVVQVFHKIITSGLPRLQPLYDCLLTIMVNSEYSPPSKPVSNLFFVSGSIAVSQDALHGNLCKTNAPYGGKVKTYRLCC